MFSGRLLPWGRPAIALWAWFSVILRVWQIRFIRPLYPTQLFDIGVNLVVLAVLLLWQNRKAFEGQLFLIYLMIYAVGRSIVEMFRGDEARGYVWEGGLTHSQFIAILVLLGCGFVWYRWSSSAQKG